MKKKNILITAANSKLGSYLTRYLSEKGYIVYATVRKMDSDTVKIKGVQYFELDLNKVDLIENIFEKISKKTDIDLVINLAGITSSGKIFDATEEDYLNLLKLNTLSQFSILKSSYSLMSRQKFGGRVININSLNGLVPLPNFGIYSASKFAADTIGLIAHMDYADSKVKITNLAPGAINFGNTVSSVLVHKPLRERIPIFKLILPFTAPESVAKKIIDLAESTENPARVIVGADAKLTYMFYRLLPLSLWLNVIRLLWQK